MQQPEQNLHLKTTQKMVENFEFFVLQLEKLNEPVTDVTLVRSLRIISKKLQSVFNKWDQKQKKLSVGTSASAPDSTGTEDLIFGSTDSEIPPREVDTNAVATHDEAEDSDDFEMTIETLVEGEKEDKISKRDTKKMRIETTPSMKKSAEPSAGISNAISVKNGDILRRLQEEGIDKILVTGTEGLCIGLDAAKSTWNCIVCDLGELSVANLKSHVNGRQHKKKLVSQNTSRESSLSRMNADGSNVKANVPDYVQAVEHFFCGKCSLTLTTKEALNSHLANAHA